MGKAVGIGDCEKLVVNVDKAEGIGACVKGAETMGERVGAFESREERDMVGNAVGIDDRVKLIVNVGNTEGLGD